MESKTLGIIAVVILCILLFPIGIGIIGGVFGLIAGLVGGMIGAIAGLAGAVIGGVFGFVGWLFESIFGWNNDFLLPDFNLGVVVLVIIIVAILSRKR